MTPDNPRDLIAEAEKHQELVVCGNAQHTNFDVGCPDCAVVCDYCTCPWPCDARKCADALTALTTPQEPQWEHGVIDGDELLRRLMDTLAYYHCRSVNPKADSPHLGYHAMSEDQREFLRERQREAAEEVLRMWAAATQSPAPQEGDARERLIEVLRTITPKMHEPLWTNVLGDQADAILAAFPVLSRDIAGEIEAEWEYATRAENGFLYEVTTLEDARLSVQQSKLVHDYPDSVTTHLIRRVVRRRKAGPWEPLPVGGGDE